MTDAGVVRWAQVNAEPFEYAIQQGPHGDAFVKLLDGTSLRRPLPNGWEARKRAEREALREVWEEMSKASRRTPDSDGLVLACAIIMRRIKRLDEAAAWETLTTEPLQIIIAKTIDGEAWAAIDDKRDALPGSLWHHRRGEALEKAQRIISGPMLQLVDWVYLHALEGAAWPSINTKIKLLREAVRAPIQADADAMHASRQ